MKNINLIIFILISFQVNSAFAKVNLLTGQFYEASTDFKHYFDKNSYFPIRRTYNSDSKFLGLFGYGWCSTLDLKLKVVKNKLTLFKCSKKVDSKINKDRKGYFTSDNNIKYYFKNSGSINKVCGKKPTSCLKLSYGNRKISLSNKRGVINLFIKNKRVTSIYQNKKITSIYSYKKNQLIEYTNNINKNMSKYSYNSSGRLNKIFRKNGSKLEIKYNKKYVTQLIPNSTCQINYGYNKRSTYSLNVTVSNYCNNKLYTEHIYSITFNHKYQLIKLHNHAQNKITSYKNGIPKSELDTKDNIKKMFNKTGKTSRVQFKKNLKAEIIYNKNNTIKSIIYSGPTNKHIRFKHDSTGRVINATSRLNTTNFLYKGKKLKSLINNRGRMNYIYRNNNLTSIELKLHNKTYKYSMKGQRSVANASKVASFLNSVYSDIGPAYNYSDELKEVF